VKVRATRVAKMSDGKTLCRPSDGYDHKSFDIELDDYEEIGEVQGDLPASDQSFPKGPPDTDLVKVSRKILRRKRP
jgi:hypothetical protein